MDFLRIASYVAFPVPKLTKFKKKHASSGFDRNQSSKKAKKCKNLSHEKNLYFFKKKILKIFLLPEMIENFGWVPLMDNSLT